MTHLLEDNRIQDSTYVGFLWIFIVGLRAASTCVGVITHVCILVEFDIVLSVKLIVFTCDIYLYSGKVNIVVHMLSSRILECLLLSLLWTSAHLDDYFLWRDVLIFSVLFRFACGEHCLSMGSVQRRY